MCVCLNVLLFCYREVASAWECRVGPPDQPASADRVQSLFNDIELYPTKTQGKDTILYGNYSNQLVDLFIRSYRFHHDIIIGDARYILPVTTWSRDLGYVIACATVVSLFSL